MPDRPSTPPSPVGLPSTWFGRMVKALKKRMGKDEPEFQPTDCWPDVPDAAAAEQGRIAEKERWDREQAARQQGAVSRSDATGADDGATGAPAVPTEADATPAGGDDGATGAPVVPTEADAAEATGVDGSSEVVEREGSPDDQEAESLRPDTGPAPGDR